MPPPPPSSPSSSQQHRPAEHQQHTQHPQHQPLRPQQRVGGARRLSTTSSLSSSSASPSAAAAAALTPVPAPAPTAPAPAGTAPHRPPSAPTSASPSASPSVSPSSHRLNGAGDDSLLSPRSPRLSSSSARRPPPPPPPPPPAARPGLLSRLSLPLSLPLRNRNRHLVDFHIRCDEPYRKYGAGDSVRGVVVLALVKPLRITHLVVSLHGYVRVLKDPASAAKAQLAPALPSHGASSRPQYHGHGLASLFQDEQVLSGEGRIDTGRYEFGFELVFPDKELPSSIDVSPRPRPCASAGWLTFTV